MTLENFLSKNKIVLSLDVLDFCEDGFAAMGKSIDPLHDEKHLLRLLDDLDLLLADEPLIDKSAVNFSVLLLAVFWHDIWKAKRFPTTPLTFLFDQLWDGIGSRIIFLREAKRWSVEKAIIFPAAYAIRKHGRFEILPHKTLEAKILWDLDRLETWSLARIEHAKKRYFSFAPNRQILRLGKFYFNHFMAHETEKAFYFPWSKNEFRGKREEWLAEVKKIFAENESLFC
ncbi:MAG: hypothetical protein Q8N98_05490 [bacterium]|nr:hypothetical protein [bacterium]